MYNADQRDNAKMFLAAMKAKEVSSSETYTSKRTVYEIAVIEGGIVKTETWIEWESKLEEPEYRYSLMHYTGVRE